MDARPRRARRSRSRCRIAALVTLIGGLLLAGAAQPATAAPSLVPVGGTFDSPIYVTAPRGDPRRLFVVERGGTIRVVLDERTLDQPFLEIPGGVGAAGEQGLLSMAFSPGYARNRRFYVFYADPNGGDIRVDEFRRSPDDPNRALPGSRRRVLTIEHSAAPNHYGGQLQFGPDGFLYISTGDGGGANDPEGDAQSGGSLLGKLLRINPLPSGGRPYTIPRDNPLVGLPGRDEIFAAGLRNPHRFSFDRVTGDLWIGDVGQNRAEEVDFLRRGTRGANFGWNCFEGSLQGPEAGCDDRVPYTPPVLEYLHADPGCDSITGGYVARSPDLTAIAGRYVYGDYCRGQIWTAGPGDGRLESDPYFSVDPFELASFGQDALGRLYVVGLNEGTVSRLVDDAGPR
ncbi:MAG: PQQ-dependent sugar dehydrogenase [Thermoleophilaceae bacterium]